MYLGLETSDALAEYYAMEDVVSDIVTTPDEFARNIEAVTPEDIMSVATQVFVDRGLTMAVIGNIQNKDDVRKHLRFQPAPPDVYSYTSVLTQVKSM